jgi:glycosyltransferase involved in cell wall biosynthesis
MRIGINALFLIPGRVGGSETYLRNLVEHLARIDTKNEYVVFTNRENSGTFGARTSHFYEVLCPIDATFRPARIVWEQFVLPLQVKRHHIDVLHSPGYTAPAAVPCRSVVTIYDLNFVHHPEDFSRLSALVLKVLVPIVARKSHKVITLSRHSMRDIVRELRVPEEKMCVIYPAASGYVSADNGSTIDDIRARHGIQSKFILTVAASHPHKNLLRLVEAYRILRKEHSIEHQLVLVGLKGRDHARLTNLIAGLSQGNVVLTGWIASEQLGSLYQMADVFVLPSLFEGFGIPVLEAMACGTPVVSSNATSLPEVVGDAGVLVDPYDVEGMAEAMYEVLSNDGLRDTLVTKGLDRVKMFSWERAARETLAVYEEVYGRG